MSSLNEAQIFWFNLEKIRDSLLLSDEEFSRMLGLKLINFIKARSNCDFLPINCVFDLAERYNFHFEDLLTLDFKLKLPNENVNLLDRYSYATYSHTKSIINILSYLEINRGHRAKVNVLRKFQISEDYIFNQTNKVNIFLISDIVKYLKNTYNFSDADFLAMGQRTPHASDNSFLKSKLTNHASLQSMYAQFFDECTHVFDINCIYKLDSMNKDYAVVASIPKKEVLEELKLTLTQFGNDPMAITRCGVVSSMTWFQYGMNSPMRRISSIYNGDKYDRYLINFAPFKSFTHKN